MLRTKSTAFETCKDVSDIEALLLRSISNKRTVINALRSLAMDPTIQARFMSMPRFDIGPLNSELSKGKNHFGDFYPSTDITSTAIAEIRNDIATAGIQNVSWTNLSDLPSMWLDSIRSLANDIFPAFGLAQNADVKVICSFSDNRLLNTPLEVNSVLGFLDKNFAKAKQGNLNLDFSEYIDNYTPEARIYYSEAHTYLVINEVNQGISGKYIYCFEREISCLKKPNL